MIVFFHMLYYVSNIFWNRVIKPKLFTIDKNDSSEENEPKLVEKRTQLYELERPENDNSTEYDADYDPARDVCVYDLLSGKLTFVPPLYIQRYQAVMKVLTHEQHAGRIHKIAEFGCAEFAMFKYYKKLPSVHAVLFVDIDEDLLIHKYDRVMPLTCDYLIQRESELNASLFCGDVSVSDERMNDVDVVVAIELIEHLYPPTLENVPYNLFGVIQPYLIIITTPNGEFNWLFDDYEEGTFRHDDHKFEWSREQFQCWAENLVTRYPMYTLEISGIGPPPACKSEAQYGHCSQMAVFTRTGERHVENIPTNVGEPFKLIKTVTYPVKPPETRSKEQILFDEMTYLLFTWKLDLVPLDKLYASLSQWCSSVDELKHLLEKNCRRVVYKPEENGGGQYYLIDDSRNDSAAVGSLTDESEELDQYDYEVNRERDEMERRFEDEQQAQTYDNIREQNQAHHMGTSDNLLSDDIQFKGDSNSFNNDCWDNWDVEPMDVEPTSSSTQIVGDKTVGDMEGNNEDRDLNVSMKTTEGLESLEENMHKEVETSKGEERNMKENAKELVGTTQIVEEISMESRDVDIEDKLKTKEKVDGEMGMETKGLKENIKIETEEFFEEMSRTERNVYDGVAKDEKKCVDHVGRLSQSGIIKTNESKIDIDENTTEEISDKINETIEISSDTDIESISKRKYEGVECFAKKEAAQLEHEMNAPKKLEKDGKELEKAGNVEDKSLERTETQNMGNQNEDQKPEQGVKIRCANLEQYIRDSLRDDAEKRREKRTSKSVNNDRQSNKRGGEKSTNQRTSSSGPADVTSKFTNDRTSTNDATTKSTNERTSFSDVTHDNDADIDTSEDSSSEDDVEETIARNEKMKNLSQEKKKLEEKIEKLSQDLSEHSVPPTRENIGGKLLIHDTKALPTHGNRHGKLIQDTKVQKSAPTQRYDESLADLRTREDGETKDLGRSSQADIDKEFNENNGRIGNISSLDVVEKCNISNLTKDIELVSNVPIKTNLVNDVVKSATDVKPSAYVFDVKTNNNSQTPVNSSTTAISSSTGFNLDSSHLPINSTTVSSDHSATGSGFDSSSLNLSSILVDTTSDGLSSSNTQFEVSYNLNSYITEYDTSSFDDIEGKIGKNEARTDANGTETDRDVSKMIRNETDNRHFEERTVNNPNLITNSIHKLKDLTNKTNQNGPKRKLSENQESNNVDIKFNQDDKCVSDKVEGRKDMGFNKEVERRGEKSMSQQETSNVLKEKSLNKQITQLGQKLGNLSLYSPEKLGRTTDWVNQIPKQSTAVAAVNGKEKSQNITLSEKQKAIRRRRSLKLDLGESSEEISRRKSLGAGEIGKKYQETQGKLENDKGDHVRQSVYRVEVVSLENRDKGDFVNQSTEQAIDDLLLDHDKSIDNDGKSKFEHRETSEIASRRFVDDLCTAALDQINDTGRIKDKDVKRNRLDNGQDNCTKKTNVETKTDFIHEKKDCNQQLPDLIESTETLRHVREDKVQFENKCKSMQVENNNEIDVFMKKQRPEELEKYQNSIDVQGEKFDIRTDDGFKEFSKLTDRVEMEIEKSKRTAKVTKDPINKIDEGKIEIKEIHHGKDVMKEVVSEEIGVEEMRDVSKHVTKGSNERENVRKEIENNNGITNKSENVKKESVDGTNNENEKIIEESQDGIKTENENAKKVSQDVTNNDSDQSTDEDDYLSCAETSSSYKTGQLDNSDTMSMFSCRSGDTQFETASEYATSFYSGSSGDDSDATLVESDKETTGLNDEEW